MKCQLIGSSGLTPKHVPASSNSTWHNFLSLSCDQWYRNWYKIFIDVQIYWQYICTYICYNSHNFIMNKFHQLVCGLLFVKKHYSFPPIWKGPNKNRIPTFSNIFLDLFNRAMKADNEKHMCFSLSVFITYM